MDKNVSMVMEKRARAAVAALRKNQFEAHYVATKEELLPKISAMLPPGCSCSVGGSATLDQTGVRAMLEQGDFNYHDRYAPGADTAAVFAAALTCDVYLTSANAVTLDGELYNMDGRANRVASICYGPGRVIVVAGHNKIVADVKAARKRLRTVAAPANALRLGLGTPCATTGHCTDCSHPERMCSQELITGWQRQAERICVFIVGQDYGY